MDFIFKDNYVNYNQIRPNVSLMDINDVLIENDIFIELGDNSTMDWAGYSYYFCKTLGRLDDQTISSFVYVITYIMTGNPVDIVPNIKSDIYYKNDSILIDCLNIYNNLLDKYEDDVVKLCFLLFENIYYFYINNHEKYIKKSERMNCLLTYKDNILFNKITGKSKSDKLKFLLDYYYQE